MNKDLLIEKIKDLLESLGFVNETIGDNQCMRYGDSYYKITYINDLSAFVIEYADNIDEAQKGLFSDGDLYYISEGENILETLRNYLIKYYMTK